MTENIVIDLHDDITEDNKKFFNLLDDARWRKLIDQAKEGDFVLEELLEDLIND
jgi:hypothetical protein